MAPYVSNGALIAAAVALGYPVRNGRHGGPNANVGVGLRELRDVREATEAAERRDLNPRGDAQSGG